MKVHFSGGANEIGASCILLEIGSKNILLDCGLRQGGKKDPLPDFSLIQEKGGVDAIIISHAHLDHTGTLPLISKEYPGARIYLNKITHELTRVLLYDSLKIMNYREGEIPLYAEQDVEDMFSRMFCVNYEVEFKIFEDIFFTFYPAGHIAGASFVSLKSKEGSFFYSGDFSNFSQKTIEGARMPVIRHDAAVIESTYGDKLHSNREVEEERLVSLIEECIAGGGKMLIPSFALGRAQEIILIIRKAKNKNRLKDVPVYIDGMIKDITRVYSRNPQFLKPGVGKKILKGIDPFYDKTISPVLDKVKRNNIVTSEEPMVIIASSGMLHGGFSQMYAEHIVPVDKNYLVFSGYQDEESPGHMLLNLFKKEKDERKLIFNQKVIPVNCRVEKIGLSAHGDKNEIKALINIVKPESLFFVHGDEDIIQKLGVEIAEDFDINLYLPRSGDSYEIEASKEISLRIKKIPFRMNEKEGLNDENIEDLWEFILDCYGHKYLTIEELICIWTGKRIMGSRIAASFYKLFTQSVYFENDKKRLFLFRARSRERVEEDQKTVYELNQQDIEARIQDVFHGFGYKKAGYYVNKKQVVLYFDFPRALDDSIRDSMKQFQEDTGWGIAINKETNTTALDLLVRQLFSTASIKKVSHYPVDGRTVIVLENQYSVTNELDLYKEKTGFFLEAQIKTPGGSQKIVIHDENDTLDSHKNILFEGSNDNKMEQNNAFFAIDTWFEDKEFKPYKRGLKSDHTGKYIELKFISPVVGKRLSPGLAELARAIGWNLVISKAFNQNEILLIVRGMCEEKGVSIIKNPSFNPNNACVTVKAAPLGDSGEVDIDVLREDFAYKTGCILTIDFA